MRQKTGKSNDSEQTRNAIITFDELKKSKAVPKEINRPKPLWEILEEIYATLDENKIPYDQELIYVEKASAVNSKTENSDIQAVLDHKKTGSFSNWTFNNIYTRILIKDELNEMEGAIAIAYNQYGIQIGFGLTYEGRKYFAHLGEEDTIMSTYACGEVKVLAYFVMIHQIRKWFPFNNANVIDQLERSRNLMNKEVSFDLCLQFIERFYIYSKKYNDCLEHNTLVSQDEFREFARGLHASVNENLSKKENISAWDLYTLGNELLQAEQDIELTAIIPIGYMWGGYVFSRLI